jgi:uncharacterized repeat protein (TIGR01451 family)
MSRKALWVGALGLLSLASLAFRLAALAIFPSLQRKYDPTRRPFRPNGLLVISALWLGLATLLLSLASTASAQSPAVAPAPEIPGGVALERGGVLTNLAPLVTPTNMTYQAAHGPVMRGPVKVYTIFWAGPSGTFPANFQTDVNQFVNDLNHSSYYNIATQYSDTTGNIGTTISLAGTWLDTTNSFPHTALTSGDLLAETNTAISTNSWTSDANSFFEILTPSGITNSRTGICGIHYFNNPAFGHILDLGVPGSCDPGAPYPNGRLIDEAINTSSHEIMETVTDPLGNAWFYLSASGEIGDLCNFKFGPTAADGSDVTLNGHRYIAQEEWSNADSGCALRYNANVDVSISKTGSPGSVVAGNNVTYTITATNPSATFESSDIQLTDTLPFGTTFQSLTVPAGASCTQPTVNGTGTVTCAINSLPAGGSSTFTLVLKVTSAPPGSLSNTASASYTSGTDVPTPAKTTSATATTTVTRTTTLTYSGTVTQDYHDSAHLVATLTDTLSGNPISGKTVTFTLGTQTGSGTTNASGVASADIVISQAPGSVTTVGASYAGDSQYLASSASSAFIITREETTLAYTGDVLIANGGTAHLGALLTEDGSVPISGRTIALALGSGSSAQSCSATSDVSGIAKCDISPVSQPLGPGTVAATFAGDTFYLPASDNKATLLFAFLPRGAFVVGDQGDTGAVTFWGAQWAKDNSLTGGGASNSMKGFADSLSGTPPSCGSGWTTSGGNSAAPPAGPLPSYMAVLVSSSIGKSGPTISGSVGSIVIVKTDPGYAPDPGNNGTGTVVAVLC